MNIRDTLLLLIEGRVIPLPLLRLLRRLYTMDIIYFLWPDVRCDIDLFQS